MFTEISDAICIETTNVADVFQIRINIKEATSLHTENLKNILNEAINLGKNKLIIDLSACSFIDSTFLGAIASNLRVIRSFRGDIKIVYSNLIVKTVLTSNGINRAMEIFDDINTAVLSY